MRWSSRDCVGFVLLSFFPFFSFFSFFSLLLISFILLMSLNLLLLPRILLLLLLLLQLSQLLLFDNVFSPVNCSSFGSSLSNVLSELSESIEVRPMFFLLGS